MKRRVRIAYNILMRVALELEQAHDPEDLVTNPNPYGKKDKVTWEYAQRFEQSKGQKKPQQEQHQENQSPHTPRDLTEENKQRLQSMDKTKKPSNQIKDARFEKPGKDVSMEDVKHFISHFEQSFEETTAWDKGFKAAGAKSYSGRLKDANSLFDKMKGRFAGRSLNTVGDVIGSRAICKNIADQQKLIKHIYQNHEIIEHDNSVDGTLRPEGYRAHHFMLKSSSGKLIELQVKTVNQQAWSGYTHDQIYKSKDPAIQNNPEVNKYTKALSDYIYAIDSGQKPGKPPEAPQVLKERNMAFDLNQLEMS